MQASWQTFINSVTDKQQPIRRDQALSAAEAGEVICDLSDIALLRVSGADAATFLQGQLSCDMAEITSHCSRLAVHCNAQGRVVATLRCFQLGNDYYLRMSADTLPFCLKHLQKFALFSKVTLEDASNDFIKLGFLTEKTTALGLEKHLQVDEIHSNEHVIMRIPGRNYRYEVITNSDSAQKLWESCTEIAKLSTDTRFWNLSDIITGLPNVYRGTQEKFLPHRINYQLINGLNFDKGCYIGQEIIARMHYRGQLKHHMYRVAINSQAQIEAGTVIQTRQDDKIIGHIVDAYPTDDNQYQALTIMNIRDKSITDIKIDKDSSAKQHLLTLPYQHLLK